MVLEKAKRLVEHGKDVVILLDSITRLGACLQRHGAALGENPLRRCGRQRAAQAEAVLRRGPQHRGRRLAHHRGHRAGGYRQPHGRGDLRGVQGNRQHGAGAGPGIADRRIYPAIDINRTGTRREELLLDEAELSRVYLLRNFLSDMPPAEAIEFLLKRMQKTEDNAEFLASMAKGG
jgi:transcription termination factor Rho